ILGAFTSQYLGIKYGVFAALGVILGAVYMLHMTARVIWGPFKVPMVHHENDQEDLGQAAAPAGHDKHGYDITAREIAILAPIARGRPGVRSSGPAGCIAPIVAVAALALVFIIQANRQGHDNSSDRLWTDPSGTLRLFNFAQYIKLLAAGIGIILVLLAWPT